MGLFYQGSFHCGKEKSLSESKGTENASCRGRERAGDQIGAANAASGRSGVLYKKMMKVLMICHGNICRSAAAEAVLNQLAREAGLERAIHADSAAATREEIGNDIYPPMRRALQARGYDCPRRAARQTVRADYGIYDRIIGMDGENMADMRYIYGGDPENKLSRLLDWAGQPGADIPDPWYTRDFAGALDAIERGCRGLLEALAKR